MILLRGCLKIFLDDKMNKRTILNLSVFLLSLVIIFYFLIFDFKSFLYQLNNFGNIFQIIRVNGLFLIAISLLTIYSFGAIHELSHWLSTKLAGYKNRAIGLFGLGIGGLFVDPTLQPNDKLNFILMASYGSIFPLALGILAYLIVYHFTFWMLVFDKLINPFSFWLQFYLVNFILIGIILGLFNLFPVIKGTDGYQVIKIKFKSKKAIFSIMLISSFIVYYLLSFLLVINLTTIIAFSVLVILNNIVMIYLDKKLNDFDSSKVEKGWHFRKSGLMIYYKF